MKFEKQVENAKTEKLKYRITRDVLFIVLGILFLIISIILAYSDLDKKIKNTNNNNNYNEVKKTK